MSMQIQVNRIEYTPRDKLLPDRRIYILKLRAAIPNDSYLITASIPSQLPDINNDIKQIIKNLREKRFENDEMLYRELEKHVERLEDIKKRRERNLFPKINDKYVIPGSTLKGAIRSRIEYKLAQKDNKSPSCYIIEDNFYPQYAANHRKFWGKDVVISKPPCDIRKDNKVCIVCDMFGSPSLSSLVSFSDAYMSSGRIEKLNDLGYEAAAPGSTFDLKITCFNFDEVRLGLLLLGLEIYSNSPIIIGMFKYRYNKKFGRFYKDKNIGMLRFELKDMIDHTGKEYNIEETIKKCKVKLEQDNSINQYIRWERGVILSESANP